MQAKEILTKLQNIDNANKVSSPKQALEALKATVNTGGKAAAQILQSLMNINKRK
jgi:hypothetical protein